MTNQWKDWPIRDKTFGEKTVAPHHRTVPGLIHEIVPTLPTDITSRTVQRLRYSFAQHGRASTCGPKWTPARKGVHKYDGACIRYCIWVWSGLECT